MLDQDSDNQSAGALLSWSPPVLVDQWSKVPYICAQGLGKGGGVGISAPGPKIDMFNNKINILVDF